MFFIFVVCSNHENIFTTKISRSTVVHKCCIACFLSLVRQLYCDQLITERFYHKEVLTGEISVSVNIGTADCKSCNMQAEKWKTTIDLLCLNREVGHAEAGKIIRFICGK